MKNFFHRPTTQNYEGAFLQDIAKELNFNNLDNITKQKVLSLYKDEYAKDFLAYRFELLNEWMEKNKDYSKEYVVALDEMIDKLYLSNELNSFEQQYIKNIQATVFAKIRNLKQLIVDFSINKDEFVFYRYDLDAFKQVDKKGLVQIVEEPELYITTQRIIVSKHIDIISVYYDQIKAYNYARAKFSFDLSNGKRCYVDSDNNRAIYESLKRVLKRSKIELK